ncbi:MAG TPA: tRNA pseudouridine(38-40) synthase TruA [Actinomycetota bacterium]|nr:tRNA pseudouridine(38-40) synthase TruA [Actinomycetota bacterium]
MKIALLIAYDGTDFHGFARQKHARTVQGELESSLTLLLRAPIETVGAGRTDAGVHAAAQVVSFEAPSSVQPEWLMLRMNKLLAPEVVVRAVSAVPEDFSARFSATRREYEYRIYRSPTPDPFRDRFSLWVRGPLSLSKMRAASRALIGEHDFSSFCRRGEGSMVRRVRAITFSSRGDELIVKIKADSFCHQMVRSIVGLLLDVGDGKRKPEDVGKALRAKDRNAAGPVAAARGLHLVHVAYAGRLFGPRG